MSRLRGNPKKHTCQNDLGNEFDKNKNKTWRGLCGEPAVIRCNYCKEYFCEECWQDHLEMTLTDAQMRASP